MDVRRTSDLIRIVGGQKRSRTVAEAMVSVEEEVSSFSPFSMILSMGRYVLFTLEAWSSTFASWVFLFLAISHLGDSGRSHQRTNKARFGAERTGGEKV